MSMGQTGDCMKKLFLSGQHRQINRHLISFVKSMNVEILKASYLNDELLAVHVQSD